MVVIAVKVLTSWMSAEEAIALVSLLVQ